MDEVVRVFWEIINNNEATFMRLYAAYFCIIKIIAKKVQGIYEQMTIYANVLNWL